MENETTNTQEQTTVDTVVDEKQGVETSKEETISEQESVKTFSQDEVNDYVRNRLSRYKKSLYSRYGVENQKELDGLIGMSQSYQAMKDILESFRLENGTLREELIYLKNNINPERYEDIRAYFKGKEIEFNADNLVKELETHPEWISPLKTDSSSPVTTIKQMGIDASNGKEEKSEKEIASKLFGLSKFK